MCAVLAHLASHRRASALEHAAARGACFYLSSRLLRTAWPGLSRLSARAHARRADVTLDPKFKEFHAYAKKHDIPIVVVSSGMTPIIRSIFANLIGEEDANSIDVISNEVKFTDKEQVGNTWELVYRHPDRCVPEVPRPSSALTPLPRSHFGHDKSLSILPYRELENPPLLFFAGDGM